MGVAFTVFCSNGHIVEVNHGGEIDISKLKCPCCNSKKFTINVIGVKIYIGKYHLNLSEKIG